MPSPSFGPLLVLLSLALQLHQALGEAFVGCADPSALSNFRHSIPSGPGSAAGTTASDCSAYCAFNFYTNAGYVTNGNAATCYCTYTIPAASALQYQFGGGDPTCEDGLVRLAISDTQYNFDTCYPALLSTGVIQNGGRGLASFTACFTACDAYAHAYVAPTYSPRGPVDTFNCTCSDSALAGTAEQGTCARETWFGYARPDVSPSAFVRKREKLRAENKRRQAQEQAYCPAGLTACRVVGASRLISQEGDDGTQGWAEADRKGSYECLDTTSELESCGGCMFGMYGQSSKATRGVDCSAIPGTTLGGTTCTLGTCQISACEDDYTLSSEGVCQLV